MSENAVYGSAAPAAPKRKTRIHHLQAMKAEGTRWAELTAYDYSSARLFEEAASRSSSSATRRANVVYGYDTTVPVTIDEMLPLVRGVVRGAPHALVIADLPFGSYEASPQQALETAFRFMKEGQAHAVKLEGGERVAPQIAALTAAGIPVQAPSASLRSPSTASADSGCRAAATAPSNWSPTRSRSRRPVRSPSSWRWSRRNSPDR